MFAALHLKYLNEWAIGRLHVVETVIEEPWSTSLLPPPPPPPPPSPPVIPVLLIPLVVLQGSRMSSTRSHIADSFITWECITRNPRELLRYSFSSKPSDKIFPSMNHIREWISIVWCHACAICWVLNTPLHTITFDDERWTYFDYSNVRDISPNINDRCALITEMRLHKGRAISSVKSHFWCFYFNKLYKLCNNNSFRKKINKIVL